MIYTVTFNPAIDYLVHLPGSLALGQVNRTVAEEYQFGGKGINVSIVLGVLGYESTALGFVAGPTGRWLEDGLKERGIHTDFVRLKDGITRINVKIKADEESEINGIGPRIGKEDMDRLYEKLDGLKAGDVLVLAGSIPNSLAGDTYQKILARLAGRGVEVAVDATRDLLVNVLEYRPFLIKPNNHELGEIFGVELKNDEEVAHYAAKLQEKGARNVLVSMAGDGALLLDEEGHIHRAGVPKGKVINSVGAGDSMVAGFLAGWMERKDYDWALRLGTASGSATAFSLGLADRQTIQQLLTQF